MKNYNKFPGSLFNPSQRHLYIGELYHRTCLIITTYYIMYLLSFRPTNKYRLIILLFTFQTTVVCPVYRVFSNEVRWHSVSMLSSAQVISEQTIYNSSIPIIWSVWCFCLYLLTIWSSQSQQTWPWQCWGGRPGSRRQLLLTKMTGGGWPDTGLEAPGCCPGQKYLTRLTPLTEHQPTPFTCLSLSQYLYWWLRVWGSHLASSELTETNSGNCSSS